MTLLFLCTLEKVSIKTDIVDSDIPLLSSKSAMKPVDLNLDLANDTAQKQVSLGCTASRHHFLPLEMFNFASSGNVSHIKVTSSSK